MSHLTPRAAARRRLLTGGAATLGVALLSPRLSLAAPDALGIRALAFDAGAIIAATDDALWRVTPSGAEPLPATGATTALATHPARPGHLFASGPSGGLRRSTDGGRDWQKADSGLPDAPVQSVCFAAANPDTLYAAVAADGLYRSEDGGGRWAFVMDRPYQDGTEHDVLSLVSVGTATGMGGIWLYAGTTAGLTRVPDCFCRWQDVTAGDAMDALAAGRTPPPTDPLPEGEAVAALAVAPDAPERILAGLASGLWASRDAGVNWARMAQGATGPLAVNPADPLHVAAARPGGLSVSRDGGVTWTLHTTLKEI